MGKKKSPVKINVDIGAKATASAKLTAKVPTSSMGRLVDALTDIIRPFTEKRGLKADLIRLQREEVAIEIVKRAKIRAEIKKQPLKPIEMKLLIPLLEHGSQEDPADDFMIDMWAELLANAVTDDAVSPRYVSLIGEMNTRQAKFLTELGTGRGRSLSPSMKLDLERDLDDAAQQWEGKSIEDIAKLMVKLFYRPARFLQFVLVAAHEEPVEKRLLYSNRARDLSEQDVMDARLLASLGLVEFVSLHRFPPGVWTHVIVEYCGLTPLGAELLRLTRPRSTQPHGQ